MDGIEGILGMSTGFYPESGPLYIDGLKNANLIENRVFGWYMSLKDETNYLDIGVIQDNAMSNPDDLVWLDVLEEIEPFNFWWTQKIEGIKIGA